jgi:hypothetical protein
MGYRTYIAEMPKKEYNKIKSMTSEQVREFYGIELEKEYDGTDYWYKGVYEYGKELYNFGKYTDFNSPKGSMKPFFKKKEMKDRYEENDFWVVTPEFLKYIIESYQSKVTTYYNDMSYPFFGDTNWGEKDGFLNSVKTEYSGMKPKHKFDFDKITDDQQTTLFEILDHIRSMRTEWTCLTPFNLEKGNQITTSWKYEYGIFELVRIYKSFDWKKNVMFYYGY